MPENHEQKHKNKPSGENSLRMFLKQLFDVNQSEIPNRLVNPIDNKKNRSIHPNWILLLLFLFAFTPRLIMLHFANGSSDDSYYYINVARILGEGDYSYRGAFYYLGLNIFPAVLLILHRLGLDWLHAGMIWGVSISALTVLPIYGWVKRLFDNRVAFVASFLFAIHPDLIEYSIDPIREPTYWFLVSLFLYLSIRSLLETKLWLFACLGMTFCLAIHTRSESWILLVPFGIWFLLQFFSKRVNKVRITTGLIVMVAITPIMLLTINLTLLKNEDSWQFGRLYYFKVVASYLIPEEENSPEILVAKSNVFPIKKLINAHTIAPVAKPKAVNKVTAKKEVTPLPTKIKQQSKPITLIVANKAQTKPVSIQKTATPLAKAPEKKSKELLTKKSVFWLYFKTLIRTHEPLFSILHLIGIIFFFRQLFLQLDKLPLAIYYFAILIAIWLRTDTSLNINGRYFHSLFFLTVPFQALGLIVLCKAIGYFRIPEVDRGRNQFRMVPVLCFMGMLTVFYWGDAFTSHHAKREEQVGLGLWLNQNMPDVNTVLVDRNSTRIGYYAQGSAPLVNYHHVLFKDLIQKTPPDLVILSREQVSLYLQKNTTELVKPLGLKPVDLSQRHPLAKRYLILAKQPPRSALHIATDSNTSSIH